MNVEDHEALLTLGRCDQHGRERGVAAPDLEEAIDYLRDLADTCG